ncbi:OmpA family protein [Rhizobium sp. LjRoot30]|uniref:OmpA family protein n=1 Tax=Rhizobium sp. LjRoot30 TaxID=3342320 RepID=UPI003ED13629
MTLRSTLFATVALPLSAVLMTGPALADGALRTYEVAQASDDEQRQLQEQQAAEEAQRAAEQQAAQEAQRAAEEQAAQEAQRAAEQQAAEEAQRAAEQQAAQEAQRAAEEQAAQEAQRAAEQQAAEEAQRAAEQQAAQEAQRAAEEQAAQEAQRAAEQQAAEEAQRAAEQQAAQEAQRAAEEQAAQEAQRAAEQQAAEEAQRAAEQQAGEEAQRAAEQKAAEEAQRAAEQQAAEEAQRAAEQKAAEDAQRAAEQQQQQTQEQPVVTEGEQPVTSDQPTTAQDQQQQQPAGDEQQPVVTEGEQPVQENQPATADGQQPADQQNAGETTTQPVVVPEIVDTRSQEEKQAIAADPSQTSETVVLPVENGAAVLDSDKDADNSGGQTSREERRKQREAQRNEEENIKPPTSDAEAQATATAVETKVIRQQIEEKGRRIKETPEFELPAGRNGGGTESGGTTINNNTVNNTINNISIVQQNDNRTVLRVDDRYVVRSDDRPRLRRDAEDSFYEELSRGRTRETIVRSNGVRLVTIYNAYGDVIQRTRIGRDGEEHLLVFAPEADRSRPPLVRDAGDDLPPMRLRIPVSDYIVDTSEDMDRDYYEFLAEPPVERVERTYSIDEVRYSARLRDKVRRIDLDTITFASGSAEVPMSQAKTLRKVADAMTKVLDRDPGETFLIEGHTDAVGSDQKNLILSDQRAEAVAALLTDVYGIPPENLVPQGYGERYLKVRTQAGEQQNRRVTVRRVTSLVRPVAQAQ